VQKPLFYSGTPFLFFCVCVVIYYPEPLKAIKNSCLLYILFISCMAYPLLLVGVSSNSVFSYVGSIRSVSQIISYEVSFIICFLCFFVFYFSFSFSVFTFFPFLILLVFFISGLAELNRAPFDFSEGESELVSGFNTEIYRILFSLLFLCEYGSIIFLSMILHLLGALNPVVYLSLIVLTRASYPRLRYDFLMYLNWLHLLPAMLQCLFILFCHSNL